MARAQSLRVIVPEQGGNDHLRRLLGEGVGEEARDNGACSPCFKLWGCTEWWGSGLRVPREGMLSRSNRVRESDKA